MLNVFTNKTGKPSSSAVKNESLQMKLPWKLTVFSSHHGVGQCSGRIRGCKGSRQVGSSGVNEGKVSRITREQI